MSKISDRVVTIKWNDAETMMEMQAAQDRRMKEIQATVSERISNLVQGSNLGHPDHQLMCLVQNETHFQTVGMYSVLLYLCKDELC